MTISSKELSLLMDELKDKDFTIKDGYIYSTGNVNGFKHVCRMEIKKKTVYVLNKNRNRITDDVNIFNEDLEKKKKGIRGYKTIPMGVIEDYYYLGKQEYAVKGSDIEGYYWWIDWNREAYIPSRNKAFEYIKDLRSEFKKIA